MEKKSGLLLSFLISIFSLLLFGIVFAATTDGSGGLPNTHLECGASSGVSSYSMPTTNLCTSGVVILMDTGGNDGAYNRKCYYNGLFALCSAPKLTQENSNVYYGYQCNLSGDSLWWMLTQTKASTKTPVGSYSVGTTIYTTYPISSEYKCFKSQDYSFSSFTSKIVEGIIYNIPSFYSDWKWGVNTRFFEAVTKDFYNVPIKATRPVITATGTRYLYFVNYKTGTNFYIPYDSGVNCTTYWQNKDAVNKLYFSAYCYGCGPYEGQEISGNYVTGYQYTNTGTCSTHAQLFNCVGENWVSVPGGKSSSSYPHLSCQNNCTDWRVGSTTKFTHGSFVTGYMFPSAADCASTAKGFLCDDGIWTGGNTATYSNLSCITITIVTGACGGAVSNTYTSSPTTNLCSGGTATAVTTNSNTYTWNCSGANGGSTASCSATRLPVINGICGSASGLSFSTEPIDSQLCSTGVGIVKPVARASILYNASYSWTCNGTGGGANMTCDLNKVYPYYQYQCQLSGTVALKWGLVNYPNGSTSYSAIGTTYVNGDTIYASPTSTNTYYIGGYSCKANGACGTSNGQTFSTQPSSNLCNIGTNGVVSTSGNNYVWSCAGINGGTSASCSANKSTNATCGTANNKSYITEPTNTQLCGTFSVTKNYGVWNNLAENANANWTCAGINGGTNANCNATRVYYSRYQCQFSPGVGLIWQPVAGTNASSSSFVTYYLDDYIYASSSSASSYTCTCPASAPNFSITDGCTAAPVPITGACGTANNSSFTSYPTSNKCSNYSSITDSDTNGNDGYYNWTCNGANGGSTASCSATRLVVVNGACNISTTSSSYTSAPSSNLCSAGSDGGVSSYANSYDWYCYGANGGSDAYCSATRIYASAGTCNPATNGVATYSYPSSNLCSNYSSITNNDTNGNDGYYNWTCNGVNGGANTSCSAPRKINGSCGNADGKSYTNPGGTAQNVKDYFAGQGLCTYSTNNPTASNVSLSNPTASWSCDGLNGGTNASCDGTYNISFSYCTTGYSIASNSAGFYTKVVGPTVGATGLATPVNSTTGTIYANNRTASTVCSAYFSCPSAGVTPVLVAASEKCTSTYKCDAGYDLDASNNCKPICDTSTNTNKGTCLAGWTASSYSGTTWTSTYGWSCTKSSTTQACKTTCPGGYYWNGTTCVAPSNVCNTSTNGCNFGNVSPGAGYDPCGYTWSCEYGDAGSLTDTICSVSCSANQVWDGSSCIPITCDAPSPPYGVSSFSLNSTISYTVDTYYDKTVCSSTCNGSCDLGGGTRSPETCVTTCDPGYQDVSGFGCCPKVCEGSADVEVGPNGNAMDWSYIEGHDAYYDEDGFKLSTAPFTSSTCNSANAGKTYYMLATYCNSNGGTYPCMDGTYDSKYGDIYDAKNGDTVWVKASCSVSTSYTMREYSYSNAYNDSNQKINWLGNLFSWNDDYYYDDVDSRTTYLPSCYSSTYGKAFYKVKLEQTDSGDGTIPYEVFLDGLIGRAHAGTIAPDGSTYVRKRYYCDKETTPTYRENGWRLATQSCGDFGSTNCPSVCSVNPKCNCPIGQYFDGTSCKIKSFPGIKKSVSVYTPIPFGCIGRAGVYPSCPDGYDRKLHANMDSLGAGDCAALWWKDPKYTLCIKNNVGTANYGDTCVKDFTASACNSQSSCIGLSAGYDYPFRRSTTYGKVDAYGNCQ